MPFFTSAVVLNLWIAKWIKQPRKYRTNELLKREINSVGTFGLVFVISAEIA